MGEVLDDRYELLDVLGQGGMGTVFRARDIRRGWNRELAIKIQSRRTADDPELAELVQEEAKIMSTLKHPSALRLMDFGSTTDGRPYFVTELLIGHTLAQVPKPMPPETVMGILEQIFGALAEAHEYGIVHCDVSPTNIFLTEVGGQPVARLLDFGVAYRTADGPARRPDGLVLGTPRYMAPEQARGDDVDGRTDLYSLGAVAYECLTAASPHTGPTDVAILAKAIERDVSPLHALRPDLSPNLCAFVMTLLERDPERRPRNALAAQAIASSLRSVTPRFHPARTWIVGTAFALTTSVASIAFWHIHLKSAVPASVRGGSPEETYANRTRSRVATSPAPRMSTSTSSIGHQNIGRGSTTQVAQAEKPKAIASNRVASRDAVEKALMRRGLELADLEVDAFHAELVARWQKNRLAQEAELIRCIRDFLVDARVLKRRRDRVLTKLTGLSTSPDADYLSLERTYLALALKLETSNLADRAPELLDWSRLEANVDAKLHVSTTTH